MTIAVPIGLAVTAVGALWALSDVPAIAEPESPPIPVAVAALPGVDLSGVDAANPCADQAIVDALAAGDDEAVIDAFGGGAVFREAVTIGNAPCISLADPSRRWVVVNKARALAPEEHVPASLARADVRSTTTSDRMCDDAASALAAMSAAVSDAGAGALGMNNGYRSYNLQVRNYSGYVSSSGQEAADASSARPGFSEHQTGFSVDVVACGNGCGSIGAFAGTSEADWVAEHAWEYGFIVRYEDGETETTGYVPEPWHLRYIGPSLAAAYHEGGYRTLEEFFGLPAAPDYTH